MNIRNCFSIAGTPDAYCRYGFFDTKDGLSRRLFAKYGIAAVCERRLRNPVNDYELVVCRVPARQRIDFLMAMAELPGAVARAGYRDYIRFCNRNLDWSENWLAAGGSAA